MKNIIISAFVAVASFTSAVPMAHAGSYYSDDDSGYTYRHKEYRHCYWKKVAWYDDYGYVHYKRVKVCDY